MKILMFSQFFPPEANAPAHRMGFFARFFVARYGDEVTAVCGTPNYPRNEIFAGYRNQWFMKRKEDGVTVIRAWAWVTKRRTVLDYFLIYGAFMVSSFSAGLRAPRADVIFATSPPLPVLFSALIVSLMRCIPLVVDIRDIWPESALAVGVLKKNVFYRAMEVLERYVYRRAKAVTVNAEGIEKRLHEGRGVPREKIHFFPNGADFELFRDNMNTAELERTHGLKDKFVVLFAGILGRAQDPLIIIETANLLREEKDIAFLLVGSGVFKGDCEKRAKELGLSNVIFAGERPRAEMPSYFARANVGLNTLSTDPLFADVISSKNFDYMAAGIPIIVNHEGEGAHIVGNAQCGLVAKGGDAHSLAERIKELYQNPVRAKAMGESGRKYAAAHYDKRVIAEGLHRLLADVAQGRSR